MFTGIVQGIARVTALEKLAGLWRLQLALPEKLTTKLQQGASVAVDGVCLTVVEQHRSLVSFDIIQETLQRTTLASITLDDHVNIERSARVGDEVGGHAISGHVHDTIEIVHIDSPANNHIIHLKVADCWLDYIMPKGYIALNGASLTIVDVDRQSRCFTTHLIPETLAQTTFAKKQMGHYINMEIDQMTISVVNTIKNYHLTMAT